MQVARWGNSLAIRIPASVAKVLELKEGDDIEVVVESGDRLRLVKPESLETMLLGLREFRGLLPADWKFDREEANAR